MSVLVSMRVKVHDFEGTKQAVTEYGDAMLKAGCHWTQYKNHLKSDNSLFR